MFYTSPIHFLFLLAVSFGIPLLSVFFYLGKKAGDATGYARGYKEGHAAPR
jgi:hypothetical protein